MLLGLGAQGLGAQGFCCDFSEACVEARLYAFVLACLSFFSRSPLRGAFSGKVLRG